MLASTQVKIMQSAAGEKITITRGEVTIDTRSARGRTVGKLVGQDGVLTTFFTVDWFLTVDQLGALGKPRRGDVITSKDRHYVVGHPDATQPAVSWHGSDETAYRVHSIES